MAVTIAAATRNQKFLTYILHEYQPSSVVTNTAIMEMGVGVVVFPCLEYQYPPVADSGGDNTCYNNDNIKKFDTSESSFRIGGSDGKVVEYMPGFNETFYNSTLPYCFAVLRGSCYDSSTGQVIP